MITLTKPDGTLLNIKTDDKSKRQKTYRGDNVLTLEFVLPGYIEIPVGTYCTFEDERYTLYSPAELTKKSTREYEYTLNMEAYQGMLHIYVVKDTTSGRTDFSFVGKPAAYAGLFARIMNINDSGWSAGNCDDLTEIATTFSGETVYDAINSVSEAFQTEWQVSGKVITIGKIEITALKNHPLKLSYMQGLKPDIKRTSYDTDSGIERLYAIGGDRNINATAYGSKTLLLPKRQRLIVDGVGYITDANGLYIERANYVNVTHREATLDCSDIYPSRVGKVTAVNSTTTNDVTTYSITDDTIPATLNYNDCGIAGSTQTIIFQSGMLVGKEFDYVYNNATHTFTITSAQIDGVTMPDGVYVPVVGDTYAVFGIQLPSDYVCNNTSKIGASWDMYRSAVDYLKDNTEQRFSFSAEIEQGWLRRNYSVAHPRLVVGGYVDYTDPVIDNSEHVIRITSVCEYVNNPYKIEIEFSNISYAFGFRVRLNKIQRQNEQNISNVNSQIRNQQQRISRVSTTAGTALVEATQASQVAQTALTTANSAKTTAEGVAATAQEANTNAQTALTTANSANTNANAAKTTAENAASAAATAESDAQAAQTTGNSALNSANAANSAITSEVSRAQESESALSTSIEASKRLVNKYPTVSSNAFTWDCNGDTSYSIATITGNAVATISVTAITPQVYNTIHYLNVYNSGASDAIVVFSKSTASGELEVGKLKGYKAGSITVTAGQYVEFSIITTKESDNTYSIYLLSSSNMQ